MFLDLLTNSPLYVYWIFFSLLFVGITQTKTREAGVKKAIGIPFILILLSIYAIVNDFGINLFSTFIWVCGIILAIFLNHIFKIQNGIQYSSLTKAFTIRGSYIPLFMMMFLFFTKYTVGVVTVLHLDVLNSSLFIGIVSLFYGIFSGMYFVRFFVFMNKFNA